MPLRKLLLLTGVFFVVSGLGLADGTALDLQWMETDDTDASGATEPRPFTISAGTVATIPQVSATTPANGATGIWLTQAVTVTFDQAVNVNGNWFTLVGSSSGAHPATVSGGPTTYTLTPDTPFVKDETVTLTILAGQVIEQATGQMAMASDYTTSYYTVRVATGTPTPIHTVQGSGLTSSYTGQAVTLQGVVTAICQGSAEHGGFYIEAPDAEQDGDPATSEGIHVYCNFPVALGDLVMLNGTISEYASGTVTETQLYYVSGYTLISSGNPLPTPTAVTLPFASTTEAERYEGMLVNFPQTLTVTDNYSLGSFGELILSYGRRPVATNIFAPGSAEYAAQVSANALNQVFLDDGLRTSYPDPTPYLTGSDPATATRRTGSTATGVTGILINKYDTYLIEPTVAPVLVDANPRPAAPTPAGTLRIASANVENLMNGDGAGGGFPTSRGASSYEEYQRQLAKVTASILAVAPDIMGLMEMENDRVTNGEATSYGTTSMVYQLVQSLNASAPAGTTYAFVDASAVDIISDVIHSVLIYRVETVQLVGSPAMLDNVYFTNEARNPLAQTFQAVASGETLTVCVNHFRAKGTASTVDDGTGLNADQGDGQQGNAYLRTKEAETLTAWLATDPTGSGDPDFLIVGDLNAYAKEDPVTAIEGSGYVNLTERFEGAGGYSYVYNGEIGHLDHALATASLSAQVATATTWHANADEPVYYNYNVENKSAAQQAINVGTPYRTSDHDPIVVDVILGPPTPIHAIQGSGLTSTYAGQTVTVQGVVTAIFQGNAGQGGYFIETPDAEQDADPATSEGLHIYDNVNAVAVGDLVTVAGTVTEYVSGTASGTELYPVTAFTRHSSGNPLPTTIPVTLPFASATEAERYEAMLVSFPQTLTVTSNYELGSHGELVLSNGRLPVATNIYAPGSAAYTAQVAANALNQVYLDDGRLATYPDPTPYLTGSDPATATRRTGGTTTGVTGILTNKYSTYLIEPTVAPVLVDANPRPAAPTAAGSLRIVSANVKNLMNGDGAGGGFPTSRGASSLEEYQRQLAKVTAGILALAPDIVGLTEVENDRVTNGQASSYTPASAVAQLVDSLNAGAPAGTTYAFIDASAVDIISDQIHDVFIYRVETVQPVGLPAMLDNVYFTNEARNPLAQTFRAVGSSEKLTVCVNHFRAKGYASTVDDGTGLNADQGDGQQTNAYLRTKEAETLTAWLATDPTGSGDPDFLIVGDLNAYAKEDAIVAIEGGGYVNLTERFEGEGGYSYTYNNAFGHLDHALATTSLNAQVVATATWHVNADEPTYYDYNLENKSAAQQAINVGTPYRTSDHDPIVVDVNLATAPAITGSPAAQTVVAGDSVSFSVTATGYPLSYQWRKNGQAIMGNSSATTATLVLTGVTTADATGYDCVVTNTLGTATSSSATLTVLTGFAAWRQTHFTTDELAIAAISGPTAVRGADGLTNLVKYALGLDPAQNATSGLPVMGASGSNYTYSFDVPSDRTDLTVSVEISTNLQTWTDYTLVSGASLNVEAGSGVNTYGLTCPTSVGSGVFFRIKVTQND